MIQTAFSSFSLPTIFPTPSTCPDTICPPKRLFNVNALSKFTRSPTCSSPKLLRDIVSGITSAQKHPLAKEITVKQTPFVAILSPTCKSSRTFFACTSNTTLRFPRLIPRMVPISSIIPVNMLISDLQFMLLDFLSQYSFF